MASCRDWFISEDQSESSVSALALLTQTSTTLSYTLSINRQLTLSHCRFSAELLGSTVGVPFP